MKFINIHENCALMGYSCKCAHEVASALTSAVTHLRPLQLHSQPKMAVFLCREHVNTTPHLRMRSTD